MSEEPWYFDGPTFRERYFGPGKQNLERMSQMYDIPRTTLSHWKGKHIKADTGGEKGESPGLKLVDGTGTAVGPKVIGDRGWGVEDVRREYGVLDGYEEVSSTVNKWEGPTADGDVATYHQTKVQVKPKVDLEWLRPADLTEQFEPDPSKLEDPEKPRLIVTAGDQQYPHVNEEFEKRYIEMLHILQPYMILNAGDGIDFPSLSKYKEVPEWCSHANDGINGYGNHLYRQRQACPDSRIGNLKGNHEQRLKDSVIANFSKLWGIKRAELPDMDEEDHLLSLPFLLHFNKLAIEYETPNGNYDQVLLKLADDLGAVHGHTVGKNASMKALERKRYSLIFGHTHRQNIHSVTEWDVDGKAWIKYVMNTGCMCRIEEGLGYAPEPDWINGGGATWLWPDGSWTFELIHWDGKHLRFNGRKF